jgi:hypothetical protein
MTVTIVEMENLNKNENRFYCSHKDEIDECLIYDNSGVEKALLKY